MYRSCTDLILLRGGMNMIDERFERNVVTADKGSVVRKNT